MNLVKFLENRYQELTFETQTTDVFMVTKDAEIKAAHQILTTYRVFLKWVLIPKVLLNFIQVKLGFSDEPQPVLLNKIKADKEAKEAAEKMLKEAANISTIKPTDVIEKA